MTHPTTPAQVLELAAEYLEAQSGRLDIEYGGKRTRMDYANMTLFRDREQEAWRQLVALNPETLRAQAAALAEREAEVERLRIALITAADLLHDCWNQWAFNTSSGKYDGGLSTLEDVDEVLFAAGVIDSKGNYITGSIPTFYFKMSELGLIVRQVLKALAPTQEAQS